MTAHKPTAEQEKIIAAAQTGGSLVIEAGAGTGKTSTLRMVAEALAPKRGLYLAYNKAIQVEASTSFPENVECRTAHSLAYRQFGAPMRHRLNGKRINAKQYAGILSITPFTYRGRDKDTHEDTDMTLEPWRLAILVKESISRFCNSADREPNARNIPVWDTPVQENDWDRLRTHLVPYMTAAWADINQRNGQLTFTHDCYLKQWSLSAPQLHYGFILFDEAQDANPAITVVVEAQRAQQIMVGDRAQAIYGWRGAVDAMQNFKADHHLYLSQSFRFGQVVAEEANRWLNLVGTPLRLTGFEQIASVVESLDSPDAILCRTNAGCIESAMSHQESGEKVAITGGTREIEAFVKAANDLMQSISTTHPELSSFRDWSEVQQAVKSGEAADLGMMVRLIDNYGTHAILDVCRNSCNPADADIIVSTAHKAKGLEWNRVKIHSDFKPPKSEDGKVSVTEAMLIYVAVTRAKLSLDNAALSWLDDIEREINNEMDAEEER